MSLRSRICRRRSLAAPFAVVAVGCTLHGLPGVRSFHQNTLHVVRSRSYGVSHSTQFSRQQCTVSNLFFRAGDKDASPPPRRIPLQPGILDELKSPSVTFPFNVLFDDDSSLTIRFMIPEDLNDVIPLCIEEFGSGATAGLLDFPLLEPGRIPDWWDRIYFQPMIEMSLLAKMNANNRLQPKSNFNDPAVLVMCRQDNKDKALGGEKVIGLVELSLQAPEANKNPPPLPLPLWFKDLYCQLTNQRLEGWVTNLLIDPKCRGLGYSKIMMAATEGVATSWDRGFIYLHADADFQSGRVAQKLYEGLGYEVVTDDNPQYAWMNEGYNNPMASIRIIEGVALLCYSKKL
jgi:ribosomal protein S18 acetylase RimI-like enzyme